MYIPVSQRKQVGQNILTSVPTGRYIPVSQRKVTPINTKEISFLGPQIPSQYVSTPLSQLPTRLPEKLPFWKKAAGFVAKRIMPTYVEKALGFGKIVQEEIARSGASSELTAARIQELDISGPDIENRIARVIFGDRPLKSIESRIAEAELVVKDWGKKMQMSDSEFKKSIGEISEWNALLFSTVGVGGVIALDFTGAGGSDNVIKVLSKADDIPFIAKLLREIGVAEDMIIPTATKLSKITDEKIIKNAIERIDEIQKTTRLIQEGGEQVVSRVKPAKYVPVAQRTTQATKGVERASFIMKEGKLVKLEKPITQVIETAVKPVVKPTVKMTKKGRKSLSIITTKIKQGVERAARAAKTRELKMIKATKGRVAVKGRLAKIKLAGEARIKRIADTARIVKQKVIRKEELKGFRSLIKERSQWKKITSKITNKLASIKSVKKDIFEFAKKTLPLEKRGKLLASVASAETRGQLSSAFRTIINERNNIIRKELTANLAKAVKEIDKLPLKWQDKIMHEMDKIAFKGMTEKTVARLTKLREFLAKQPEAELLFGRKTLKKTKELQRLDKQNIADMSLRDLIKLNAKINNLSEEGKLAKKVIADTKQLQQEAVVKRLKVTSKNIDKEIPRTIGIKQTRKQKLVNGKYQIAEQMHRGHMNYVSSDIGFEILDNNVRMGTNMKTFKVPFDEAFYNYKEMNSGIVDNYFDFKKGLEKQYGKFENHNMERIMIHATLMQKGGREKLIKSGIDKLLPKGTTLDNMALTKAENELYQFMRGVFDELHPHIDNTLRSAHNRKLGQVDNYFSWQTDFNNSDEVFKRLENDYILSSRTQQAFTQERTLGKQVIKVNAENVFLKHVNDSTYFVNTEELLNNLGKIARDDGYQVAVGKNGQKWVQGWIDLQARKNIPEGYKPTWLTSLLNNVGAGILGFRISPIVKQPIAKITSSALLGKHTFKYDAEFFSQNLSKYIKKISKQQEFRTLDDPAFVELAKNKKLAKWQEWGYQGMKWVDGYTADSVWYASYRKYFAENNLKFNLDDFKKGVSDKNAVEYADLITRRTQGSGEAKDLARMLVGKDREVFRSILKFQTFILNESYLISHDAIGVKIKTEAITALKGKKYSEALKSTSQAIGIIMAYVMSGLAEDYVSSGVSQLFSPAQYAEKEREKKFMNRIFDSILSKVPGVNNLYSIYKYDSTGTVITDLPKNAISGGKSVIQGKKPETKIKGLSRVIESIGQSIGIAGISQAGQIFRKYGIPEEKKKPQTPSEWRKSQGSSGVQTPSEWLKANK